MNRIVSQRVLFMLCVGGGIGTFVAFGLYVTKPTYVALLPIGFALLTSTVLVKNFRIYWFIIFLLSLQFEISKNLNDGLAVIDRLKIDYTISTFTFEITATDLALLVLLAIWASDRMFHAKPLRLPPVTWLAVGYLGICLLSTLDAASPYLGVTELARQIKFFFAYVFAVNCLESRTALRVLAIVGVVILATQGAVTMARFETGYMYPLSFGDSHQDLAQIEQYLTVNRSEEGSAVRAFGTLGSPGGTTRLCMMVIPFALFLCVPNTIFRNRFVVMALTAIGVLGLVFTFTRAYYILTAFQVLLAFAIIVRERMLKRQEIVLIVMLGVAALAAISPKLYQQFTIRTDSVSVRLLQYEATVTMILENPILGVGLNNSTGQKPNYSNVTYNRNDPNTQFDLEPTHSLYLSMASEIGIVGTTLFLVFFARVTLLAWQQSRHATDPEVRLIANALVVVFCAVALSGTFDILIEGPVLMLLWLYAGITFNLSRIASGGDALKPPDPGPAKRAGWPRVNPRDAVRKP